MRGVIGGIRGPGLMCNVQITGPVCPPSRPTADHPRHGTGVVEDLYM